MSSKFNEVYEKHLNRLDEVVKKDYFRDERGKMVIKHKASRPGYRVKMIKGKPTEVRMTSKETRNRKVAAKKSALKRYRKTTTRKKSKTLVKIGN